MSFTSIDNDVARQHQFTDQADLPVVPEKSQLGPAAVSTQFLREPCPEAFLFIARQIVPPRPPVASTSKPWPWPKTEPMDGLCHVVCCGRSQ